MSLKSMTGFGRGEARANGVRVQVELSSVNRKTLDIRIGLPRFAASLESRLAKQIQKAFSRGNITGTVNITTDEGRRRAVVVDESAARSYLSELRKTARNLDLKDDLSLRSLLQFPDVVHVETPESDPDALYPAVSRALRGALKDLRAMRIREGEALTRDLARRMQLLATRVERIKKRSPAVTETCRTALLERLSKAGVQLPVDDPAIVRELAIFADRSDITEEITRLQSHLCQATDLLAAKKPVGRTLDFLSQEMFREINTIGAKANDARIAKHVVIFKTELERVREQAQNVE